TILSLDPMFPPNSGNLTDVRILPFGGYAVITRVYNEQNYKFTLDLYDEDDNLSKYDYPFETIYCKF
ncbi:21553_t:CDS:1, partial [Gigaspora margarita]